MAVLSRPRTAVIGAGISGLTAGKMLDDYAVPYVCFESSDRVGGNWAFGNPNGHSSAYRSLHIDTSKHQLSFRDFPIPDEFPDFPHHTQIKAYLDAYADAFGLREHIEFGNGVVHAERLPGGGWEIEDQAGALRRFDLLVVANGHHWDPRYADFPGTFDGTVIHSHHYVDPRTPLDLSGTRILVVGIGNSAADIAVELSSKALGNEVTLSTRSGAWIVPKYIAGRPADKYFRTFPHIPLGWQRKVAQWGSRSPRAGRRCSACRRRTTSSSRRTRRSRWSCRCASAPATSSRSRTSSGSTATPCTSSTAPPARSTSSCWPPATTSRSRSSTRTSSARRTTGSGSTSGCSCRASTTSSSSASPRRRRRCSRSSSARRGCSAAYAAGHYRLPPAEEMERVITEDQQRFTGHMVDRPRHTQQVDYFVYEHDLRTRELPRGRERAAAQGTPVLAGRAGGGTPGAER